MTFSDGNLFELSFTVLNNLRGSMTEQLQEPAEINYGSPPYVNKGEAVKVYMKIYINDIYSVDSVSQVASMNVIYCIYWKDDRIIQRNQDVEDENAWDAYEFKPWVDPEKIWEPKLEIVNLRSEEDLVEDAREVVNIPGEGPYVIIHMDWMGELTCPQNLKHFPFDTQMVYVTFRSSFYPKMDMELVATPKQRENMRYCLAPDFDLVEWDLLDFYAKVCPHVYPMMKELEGDKNATYSDFRLEFILRRKPKFYITKIYLQFLILLIMDLMVFLLDPSDIATRSSISITLLLTAVALNFAVQTSLPKINYNTTLDQFINTTYFCLFLVFLEGFLVFKMEERAYDNTWMVDLTGFAFVVFVTILANINFVIPFIRSRQAYSRSNAIDKGTTAVPLQNLEMTVQE